MFHVAPSLTLCSITERLPEDELLWIEFPTGSSADIGWGSVVGHLSADFPAVVKDTSEMDGSSWVAAGLQLNKL